MKKFLFLSCCFAIILTSCSSPSSQFKIDNAQILNNILVSEEMKTYSDPARGFEFLYPAKFTVREEKDGVFFSEQIGDKKVEQIIISHGLDIRQYTTPNSPGTSENKTIGSQSFFIQKDITGYDIYYPRALEIEILFSEQYKNQAENILKNLKLTFIHESYETEAGGGVFALGYMQVGKAEEFVPVVAIARPNEEKIGFYAISNSQLQDLNSEFPKTGFKGDITSAVLSYDGEKLAFIDNTNAGKEVIKIINLADQSEKILAQPMPEYSQRTINKMLVWDNQSTNLLAVAYINDKSKSNLVYSVNINNDKVIEIWGEYDYKGEPQELSLKPVGFSADGLDYYFSDFGFDGTLERNCTFTVSHIVDDPVNDTSRVTGIFGFSIDKSYCEKKVYNNIAQAKFLPETIKIIYWAGDRNSIYQVKEWPGQGELLIEPKWPLHSGIDMKFALSKDGKNLLYVQDYGDVGFSGAQVYNFDLSAKTKVLLFQLDTSWMP
jgi:hypothetical protein